MKQLPDFVAIIIPSTGNAVLPATIGFTRPNWIYAEYPSLSIETSWYDLPEELKNRQTLETVPQSAEWDGWGVDEPIELSEGQDGAVMAWDVPVVPKAEKPEEQEEHAHKVNRDWARGGQNRLGA